jgi:hypothetical protein
MRQLKKARCLPLILLAASCLALPASASKTISLSRKSGSTKPPVSLNLGIDFRLREVTLHNLMDFDTCKDSGLGSDSHFFRFRVRIPVGLTLRSGITLQARFTTEVRKYLHPFLTPEKTEIILDHLYLDFPRLPYVPMSARIGRQDIKKGEGFIILEGGPLDGSRSIYHNAIVLGVDGAPLGLRDTKIDLIAIHNPYKDKLVLANDLDLRMIEHDESALGVYLTVPVGETDPIRKTETFYFYKVEKPDTASYAQTKLHTVGMRMSGKFPWELDYGIEAAYQGGAHYDLNTGSKLNDHSSYGGYVWLKRSFFALFHPTIHVGSVLLSGDDVATDKVEAWNPLFARWPKWSELYIYTLAPEGGVEREDWHPSYWTNLLSFYATLDLKLSSAVDLLYTFHGMNARHPLAQAEDPNSMFGTGKHRGDLHILKLSAAISESLTGHFLIERFTPRSFYKNAPDDALFVRWEITAKL